jgi:hypothetical protein
LPETKDILNWCFTLAALDFGVFGFLYSVYATASFQATPENPARPPITDFLRKFCRVAVLVLVILFVLSVIVSLDTGVDWRTWVIVFCVALLTFFSAFLAYKME